MDPKKEVVEKVMELFSRIELVNNDLLSEYLTSIFFLAQEYYFYFVDNFSESSIDKNIQPRTNLSIKEKIDLVEDFYKSLGFPYSINEAVKNGSFDLIIKEYDQESDVYDGKTLGIAKFEDDHIDVQCTDYGTLFDTISWVHELAHYNNISKNNEKENSLLTESMSFTMTLLYADYLKERGYSEAGDYFIRQYYSNFLIIEDYYYFLMFLTIYNEIGSIDYDSFKQVLGETEHYNDYIENAYDLLEEEELEELLWHVLGALRYVIADYISIYLYEGYKEDPSTIERIIRFNEKIKHPTNIVDILNTINLPEVDTKEFHEKVLPSLEKFTNRIKNEINIQKTL